MSPGSRSNPHWPERSRLAARRSNLRLRARLIQALRRFFARRGYLEVETPVLTPELAPETHIDAIPAGGAFLHTSPELCMKRLLAAGYAKVFQICRCFREGERGARHVPEFTLLEWYCQGIDYTDLMGECEALIRFVSEELGSNQEFLYQGRRVALEGPWERLSVEEAFRRHAPLTLQEALAAGRFDEIMVERIEPRLGCGRPTFLQDYPASLAALARLKEGAPHLAERFELYIAGLELANAFSELVNPEEQRARFVQDRRWRQETGKAVYPFPEHFLQALAHMPPAAGIALGVDRLAMLFADAADIKAVLAFTPEEL